MNEVQKIIKDLGEPYAENKYILYVYDGVWWMEHENTGHGEPVEQWLKRILQAKYKGKDLEFISCIGRDGQKLEPIYDQSLLDDEYFTLIPLSLTEKTYIAHGFNSFVVKKKK